jgi:glycosyltransferase involved in cell wall biosynthesis
VVREELLETHRHVLFVKFGATSGLRAAEDALSLSLQRAGAQVTYAHTERPAQAPTLMLTDLLWAFAAARAARSALAELGHAGVPPGAIVYSTTTAALFWPRPGAIYFDSPAAANRPGRHGLWQRPLERRRLRAAPLLLPWSEGGLAEACAAVPSCAERAVVLAPPLALAGDEHERERESAPAPAPAPAPERDVAAVTYAANPHKKGLDRVLAAWREARHPGEQLHVVGIGREQLGEAGFTVTDPDVAIDGPLAPRELRALLRRTRVFLCAARREDYGTIQLEALAEGCQLVSTPSPGPYVALGLAHTLDPRLIGEDLARALRAALDSPSADYAVRAAALLEPFTRAAYEQRIAAQVLPRLLGADLR